ncbi:DUF1294 domain-containing protein [Vibrio sp. WJH972]
MNPSILLDEINVFSFLFLVFASAAVLLLNQPTYLIFLYLGSSVVTYAMFAKDKRAAQNGRWRTPENTLLTLSLIGGWPGALFAQRRLRHKTKKQPFKMLLWLMAIINIGTFVWTFTPKGSVFVHYCLDVFKSLVGHLGAF